MPSRTIHSDRRENRTKFLKDRICTIMTSDPDIKLCNLAERLSVGGSSIKRWIDELKKEGRLK
jgi:predicted ArsR family transcriptional regulator